MENTIQAPTVGSQFTTQKSAVTGTVTEVKENKNGTLRIKLDVNGQDRWTTVKQLIDLGGVFLPLHPTHTNCQTYLIR